MVQGFAVISEYSDIAAQTSPVFSAINSQWSRERAPFVQKKTGEKYFSYIKSIAYKPQNFQPSNY
jgi:hypothetical protein